MKTPALRAELITKVQFNAGVLTVCFIFFSDCTMAAASTVQPFVMEHCVLLTNEATDRDLGDFQDFIEKNLKSVFRRGANTRLMILSGCHGDRDGNDGVNKLEQLGNRGRNFYEEMCRNFGLQPKGTDPRLYQGSQGRDVRALKSQSPPVWGESYMWKFPDSWKNQLSLSKEEIFKMKIQVIDIGWYYNKIEKLQK